MGVKGPYGALGGWGGFGVLLGKMGESPHPLPSPTVAVKEGELGNLGEIDDF